VRLAAELADDDARRRLERWPARPASAPAAEMRTPGSSWPSSRP